MISPVLLDTGPLVAALNRRDRFHVWASGELAHVRPPALTCEAVLTEACFLLRLSPNGPRAILDLVRRGLIAVPFRAEAEVTAVSALMERYADVPMSFADACLVRMSEQHAASVVLTLDRDFSIYRKHGRAVIPLRTPASE